MGAPYVSSRRLADNSMSAMLAAIELYNKPRVTYRDELTVILVVNAWELALKAMLRKARKSIFYHKKYLMPYRSLAIDDALGRVSANDLWPEGVDGVAVTANVKALAEFRDRAIHLYNAPGLGALIYPFLQQNVLNYRDLMVEQFKKDLADSVTWQLLPLGAVAPADSVQFMKVNDEARMLAEVERFLVVLRSYVDEVEAAGNDVTRVATVYDINLQSVKTLKGGDLDLVVAVSPTASAKVVVRRTDPNKTHPYSMTELLAKVNKKRKGRKLTSHDHQALCWRERLRENPKYAWKHEKNSTSTWSSDAIGYMVSLTDDFYDELRDDYRTHRSPARKTI